MTAKNVPRVCPLRVKVVETIVTDIEGSLLLVDELEELDARQRTLSYRESVDETVQLLVTTAQEI